MDHLYFPCYAFLCLQVPCPQHDVLSSAINPIHTHRPAQLPTPALYFVHFVFIPCQEEKKYTFFFPKNLDHV